MPDVREIFEVSTQAVRPMPGALERQEGRQRRTLRRRKTTAIAVAMLIVLVPVASFAFDRASTTSTAPAATTDLRPASPTLTAQHAVIVGLDGTVLRTIPNVPRDAHAFAMSPDGTTLAFSTFLDGDDRIGTIGIDGSNLRIVTPSHLDADAPAWSPNASAIVFEGRRGGNTDLFVVDPTAGRTGPVSRLTDDPAADVQPSWSPDGRRIVFVRDAGGAGQIETIPAGGGIATQLTSTKVDRAWPSYSPNGRTIVFQSRDDAWEMRADGSGAHALHVPSSWQVSSDRCCTGFTPTFSPDGTKLAYTEYLQAWGAVQIDMHGSVGSHPTVGLHVFDLTTGRGVTFPTVFGMVGENRPVWLSNDELLLNAVGR